MPPDDMQPTADQIKWAMNAWSRVCQRRVTAAEVTTYAAAHGWVKLEEELRYWLRMSKAPKPPAITPLPLFDSLTDSKLQISENAA